MRHKFNNEIFFDEHQGKITFEAIKKHSENFSKPTLYRNLVKIEDALTQRAFFEQIDSSLTLQWRVKQNDAAVSIRDSHGNSDYNYVTGKIGSGFEFLEDIFTHKLDVYSHLGTISSGYNDPYPWGKLAFNKVKQAVFSSCWFDIPQWIVTGHMFLGNSTQEYGEPIHGAVGSDWHMFPTLNIFVMIAGEKRWSTRPPMLGDQYKDFELMFATSSGRENPGGVYKDAETFQILPGDVLVNPPFEWHKVLNAKGLSIGAAFRVIDTSYLDLLNTRKNLDCSRIDINADFSKNEELAHFLTSSSYASKDLKRAQMLLNDIEYAYLRRRKETIDVTIGH